MIWELLLAALALGLLLAVRIGLLMLLGRGRPMRAGGGPVKTMVVLGSGAPRLARAPPLPLLEPAASARLDASGRPSGMTLKQSWQAPVPSRQEATRRRC
jgi:hypothetical protein